MFRLVLVILGTLWLTSCVAPNTNYRTIATPYVWNLDDKLSQEERKSDERNSIIEIINPGREDEFSVVYFEFDDQGSLHSQELTNKSLDYLKDHTQKPSIVVVFTHGWHHNSAFEDENVESFRRLLARLSKATAQNKHNVIGVYVGWRGDSIETDYLNLSTFYDRKDSARQVGFGATPIFVQIESIVKYQNAPAKNYLVTMGHSFGAAATYTALAPILQERFVRSRANNNQIIEGFGDLVVLLNPAFEAQWHLPLFNLTQNDCEGFSPHQPPRLLILTSIHDKAVRWGFVAAQRISSIGDRHRNDVKITLCSPSGESMPLRSNQINSEKRSPGDFGPTVTHCLDRNDKNELLVRYKQTVRPHNPYMTFSVASGIISGHSTIWEKDIFRFVTAAILGKLDHSIAFRESPFFTDFNSNSCPNIKNAGLL